MHRFRVSSSARYALAGLALLCAVTVDTFATQPRRESRIVTVGRLAEWVTAVYKHEPGTFDGWARQVEAWPAPDVEHVVERVLPGVVVGLLTTTVPDVFLLDLNVPRMSADQVLPHQFHASDTDTVRRVIDEALKHGDANRLLKRAALLHTDIALHAGGDRSVSKFEAALVIQRFADGRQTTGGRNYVHWQTARKILDLVVHPDASRRKTLIVDPAGDVDVRAWYVAASAHMVFTDVFFVQHFDAALTLFPTDTNVLMLAGAAHARLATAEVQRVVRGTELTRGDPRPVGSERQERRRAESLFRSSLSADPSNIEARVRLGRLLALTGRVEEAMRELESALAGTSDPLLQYYASLSMGDVAETAGNITAAYRSYERARDLYPSAQSPRIALSRLAAGAPSRPEPVTELAPLFRGTDDVVPDDSDPWWQFYQSAGRHAPALMARWYAAVTGTATR